ncbi:hypothetical protein L2U69_14740 [Zavarzinia compransoris]|uniref:Nmad3 family putative nucleotide modification protein n=1 Tax=Zavarzinia marina TaxID=2911065 RepID=UPI001F2E354A|nr:hypothetical protein [Zavarzinia marina]MCF4166907.1 hypothetical protein [Zavarzinia marina]
MRIIFSRKGFDTAAGGAASPIVGGRPVSLPIPALDRSRTTYAQRGLGDLVEVATRGRIGRDHLCHDDPMFFDGRCLFGQDGAAQGHLRNQGVGIGDVFLFFGLFAEEATGERHHRIFGAMTVEAVHTPVPAGIGPMERPHPHGLGAWGSGNCLYEGPGALARRAGPELRLTRPGGPLRQWIVPPWLRRIGLSYHGREDRWQAPDGLAIASRGQEFVAHVGDDAEALDWRRGILALIEG